MAVLGDVADAGFTPLRGSTTCVMSRPPSSDAALDVAGRMPDEGLDQLGLAVPEHAGDADDLAPAHLERQVVQEPPAVRRLRDSEPSTSSSTVSVTVDSCGLGRRQFAADHQLGELARRSTSSGCTVATVRP